MSSFKTKIANALNMNSGSRMKNKKGKRVTINVHELLYNSDSVPCINVSESIDREAVIDDHQYEEDTFYIVSNLEGKMTDKSLIDKGANRGIAGDDMRRSCWSDPPRYLDVRGIDNHEIPKLQIGSYGCVTRSQRGEVVLIFHQ